MEAAVTPAGPSASGPAASPPVVSCLAATGSLLRTPGFGSLLRPLIAQVRARWVFLDPGEAVSPSGLEGLLASARASRLLLLEVPPREAGDSRFWLLATALVGEVPTAVLLQSPESGPAERELATRLHVEVLEYGEAQGLAGGLGYLLARVLRPGTGEVPGPVGGPPGADGWVEVRRAHGALARGTLLGQMGRLGEEVGVYRAFLDRLPSDAPPELREVALRARVNLASSERVLGRRKEALAAYARVAQEAEDLTTAAAREARIRALVLRGELLGEAGDRAGELASYDLALEGLRSHQDPSLEIWTARAWLGQGVARAELGQPREALEALDRLVERFRDAPSREAQDLVAKAMVNRAITLNDLWEKGRALSQYDELIDRFGETDAPDLQLEVTKARINRGVLLGEMGRGEEEIAQYDEVVAILDGTDDPALEPSLARALLNKAVAVGQRRRYREELAIYADIARRFDGKEEPALREPVARAMINEALALMRLGQDEEAAFALDHVLHRYHDDPQLARLTSEARELRARLPGPSW